MSSLAAARADNFYYPPHYDPKKHGGLNKLNGQHALRERAKKIDQGILVIRFEVPFNIWCDKCGEHIAKGVRFNAEKKQIGNYHSTKIWSFSMRHHCGSNIVIQTDPKNTEYVVTNGARRKVEEYAAEDAETLELPNGREKKEVEDPLEELEVKQLKQAKIREGYRQLNDLREDIEVRHKNDYNLNKNLRASLRAAKKADKARCDKRRQLGLPDHIKLLPESSRDAEVASLAFAVSNTNEKFMKSWTKDRSRLLHQPIFDKGPPKSATLGKRQYPASSTMQAKKGRLDLGVKLTLSSPGGKG